MTCDHDAKSLEEREIWIKKLRSEFDVVAGHAGKLIFGTLGKEKVPVMLLVGRAQSVATILHSPLKDIHAHSFSSQFLRGP
jgi:hypothetical protein